MTGKEIKKLKRVELLEMLVEQAEEMDAKESELKKLRKQVSDRRVIVQQSGTLAEAVVRINDVFTAAQTAADEYLENVRVNEEESKTALEEARLKAEKMVSEAEQQAQAVLEDARKQADEILKQARVSIGEETDDEDNGDNQSKKKRSIWPHLRRNA